MDFRLVNPLDWVPVIVTLGNVFWATCLFFYVFVERNRVCSCQTSAITCWCLESVAMTKQNILLKVFIPMAHFFQCGTFFLYGFTRFGFCRFNNMPSTNIFLPVRILTVPVHYVNIVLCCLIASKCRLNFDIFAPIKLCIKTTMIEKKTALKTLTKTISQLNTSRCIHVYVHIFSV